MMLIDFDWDPDKAQANLKKHGITFRQATEVFRDPLAITLFDGEHSEDEDRWVTLGCAQNGQILVVVHMSQDVSATELHIRIISARRAETAEVRDYQQAPQ